MWRRKKAKGTGWAGDRERKRKSEGAWTGRNEYMEVAREKREGGAGREREWCQ